MSRTKIKKGILKYLKNKYPSVEQEQEDFFMSSNCEWFLSSGILLSGVEAETHLLSILSRYSDLFERIRFVLDDCLDNCAISQETTLPNTVMFSSERLGIIQIQLELLLEEISSVLEDN